jgi:hypothetical protein
MERLREFRDTIMPRSELVELGEASPIRRSLASLVAMSISALSTVWDLDNDLVDQMQSWKETAQRPSRTYSIGMVTKMSMDDEVDALSLSMTSAIYAAGNNGAKLGLSNSSLRHALDLIEAYPPTPVADAS